MTKTLITKKRLLTICLAAVFLCCFVSCNDDENDSPRMHKKTVQKGEIGVFSYTNKGERISMLEFSSKEDFLSTIERLETENNIYNDEFYSTFNDKFTKDSNFYIIEEDYDFDNQSIYKQFEKQFNYESMRSVYASLEEKWLDDGKMDMNNHPFNIYPYSTEEQTLFNQYGEVKIGDTILKVTKGEYMAFGDCDTNALIKYNNGDSSIISQNNIVSSLKFKESSEYCKYKESKTYRFYPISVQNIELKMFRTCCFVSFYNCWFYAKANVSSKFFVYNSSKKKYVSAGTNQMLSSSVIALYDMFCQNNVNSMERGYVKKCAHALNITRTKREWLDHYRIHAYGHSIRVSYKAVRTPAKIFFIDFWNPGYTSMDE